jgi:hypothetical protein
MAVISERLLRLFFVDDGNFLCECLDWQVQERSVHTLSLPHSEQEL